MRPLHIICAGLLALAASASCTRPAGTNTPDLLPSGATLWSQNCGRCHQMRPSTQYDDGTWGLVVFHMRIRNNLTAAEYRAIRGFLEQGR